MLVFSKLTSSSSWLAFLVWPVPMLLLTGAIPELRLQKVRRTLRALVWGRGYHTASAVCRRSDCYARSESLWLLVHWCWTSVWGNCSRSNWKVFQLDSSNRMRPALNFWCPPADLPSQQVQSCGWQNGQEIQRPSILVFPWTLAFYGEGHFGFWWICWWHQFGFEWVGSTLIWLRKACCKTHVLYGSQLSGQHHMIHLQSSNQFWSHSKASSSVLCPMQQQPG